MSDVSLGVIPNGPKTPVHKKLVVSDVVLSCGIFGNIVGGSRGREAPNGLRNENVRVGSCLNTSLFVAESKVEAVERLREGPEKTETSAVRLSSIVVDRGAVAIETILEVPRVTSSSIVVESSVVSVETLLKVPCVMSSSIDV